MSEFKKGQNEHESTTRAEKHEEKKGA